MRLEGAARRLTILIDESDKAPHGMKPLYCEIVHRAHQAGLAGASVFHGIEGYGASRHVHENRVLSWSGDLPVAIVIIDAPERIDAFLPTVQALVTDGLVTVDDLRAIGRRARGAQAADEATDADRHPGVLRRLVHLGGAAHEQPREDPSLAHGRAGGPVRVADRSVALR